MAWLRAKTCVFVLFGLITFGQAYPYSYAWAESRHAACGCNQSGRKCIHGCDLKKRPKSSPRAEASPASPHAAMAHDHAAMEHDHAAMGHGHHPAKDSPPALAKQDDSRPHWINPDCSQQKKREVLDFRGDPFFPEVLAFFYPAHSVPLGREPARPALQRSFLPDPPPPKG